MYEGSFNTPAAYGAGYYSKNKQKLYEEMRDIARGYLYGDTDRARVVITSESGKEVITANVFRNRVEIL